MADASRPLGLGDHVAVTSVLTSGDEIVDEGIVSLPDGGSITAYRLDPRARILTPADPAIAACTECQETDEGDTRQVICRAHRPPSLRF